MQVHPAPAKPETAASTDGGCTSGNGEQRAIGVQSSPPSYEPTNFRMPPVGYDPYLVTMPGQYVPTSDRPVAPLQSGYSAWSGQQAQWNNNQNTQVNLVSAQAPMPVVVLQPPVTLVPPSSYMGWSIFNFLCCCWPLGLAAIIYSAKVGSARTPEEAKNHSLTARNLNISSTVIAPLLVAIIIGAYFGSSLYVVGRSYSDYNSYSGYNYSPQKAYSHTAYASDFYSYYSYYYDSQRYYYYSYSYTAYSYSSNYYYYNNYYYYY